MSTWNHRVVKTVHKGTRRTGEPYEEESFAIHEVHYRGRGDDTPRAMTVEPRAPVAESLEGLRWMLEAMLAALDKPVLTDADFPGTDEQKSRFGKALPWDALCPQVGRKEQR